MINTKILVLGGLLAVLSAVFQIIPVFFSEALVILTIFSTLPQYIISRISLKAGILAYFTAFILILLFSIHEAIFFVFTNGIIGLSLGSLQHIYGKKIIVPSISSLVLALALYTLNFILCIPVFGTNLLWPIPLQICLLVIFSLIYCTVYFYISNIIFNLLK